MHKLDELVVAFDVDPLRALFGCEVGPHRRVCPNVDMLGAEGRALHVEVELPEEGEQLERGGRA